METEVVKFDAYGNKIYHRNLETGFEVVWDYDERGNMIHIKNSSGSEEWKEYDENNREIRWNTTGKIEVIKEYDERGNMIHRKQTGGIEVEEWRNYDENNRITHYKFTHDNREFFYYKNGKRVEAFTMKNN